MPRIYYQAAQILQEISIKVLIRIDNHGKKRNCPTQQMMCNKRVIVGQPTNKFEIDRQSNVEAVSVTRIPIRIQGYNVIL